MKLTEIAEEPMVWTMTAKVMRQHTVNVNIMQYGRDSTSWHHGALINVTKTAGIGPDMRPSTTNFNYHINYQPGVGPTKTFTLSGDKFEKLKLYKDHENKWTLSDRKPQADDEL